jgi:hypothetical protein
VLLQVADDTVAREFQGRPEGKGHRSDQAKQKRHEQDREVRPGVPNQINGQEIAHREGENFRSPKAYEQSGGAADQSQEQSFCEQLPDDPPAAPAEREPNRYLFPARGAAGQEHVRQIQTRDHQND